MMKVKIVKNKTTELLERDINDTLAKIGSEPNSKIDLKDIKINIDSDSTDRYLGILIYNVTKLR